MRGNAASILSQRDSRPGHDPRRDKDHCAATLAYFHSLPRNLTDKECPSTAELTRHGRFGLRPPNRINDLVHGRFDGHHYDFEKIAFGRGEYRWRLHWPNRPGYPKNERQSVLPLESTHVESPQIRKARKSPGAWKAHPIVPLKSWEQVCAERDRKIKQSEPEFELTP